MNTALRAWRASFTRRWHQNYELCDTLDYDAGHQGRVALLILAMYPEASRELLVRAITHDQGEVAAGDMCSPMKWQYPDLVEKVKAIEDEEVQRQGFPVGRLTKKEEAILGTCDRLDAWLWMMRHKRSLYARADWQQALTRLRSYALAAGLDEDLDAIIDAEVSA